MSAAPQFPPNYGRPEDSTQQPPPLPPRRPLWQRTLFWAGIGLGGLILLMVVGGYILLHSRSFHEYVLRTARQNVSNALGVPVRMQEFALNFSGISPTLDVYGVVVEGAQPYANPPLLQVQHARVGLRVVSLLHKKWYLSDVTVHRPVIQVFVDKGGKSNIPTPKSNGGQSNVSIFDLAIQHALLDDGEIFYNDRKSVLDADLHNLTFSSGFDDASRRYAGTLSYNDGHLRMESFNTINHDFRADFAATPEKFTLHHAVLRSGKSVFSIDATLIDYAAPKIDAVYNAVLDSGEFRHIMKNPTLPAGLINLGGKIQYAVKANVPFMKGVVVDGMLSSGLLQVQTPSFRGNVRNIAADYSLKKGDVEVSNLKAVLLGGEVNGHLTMRDIAGDSKSHLEATVKNLSLAQVKAMTNSPALSKVGLTGSLNANADAVWGKTFDDLQATSNIKVQAKLTSQQSDSVVPVDGAVHARYSAPLKQVTVVQSFVRSPQTSLNMNGTVSDRSALQVRLQSNDLHEMETIANIFQTQTTGPHAQPLGLGGTAIFNGAVSGSTTAPHITGQLTASNLSVRGTKWRLLRTNIDAGPSRASVRNGELAPITRGRITFNVSAALHQWSPTKQSSFEVTLDANQLDVGSLLKAAGVQMPVEGTLTANVQAHGTQLNPVGQGIISLNQAKVSGETIQAAILKFEGTGDAVRAHLDLKMPAGTANGVVTYSPKNEAYDAELHANGVQLNQLQAIKEKDLHLQGVLNIDASGRGTLKDPQLVASIEIPKLVIQNQTINGIRLQANIANQVANVSLDSQAINTTLKGRAKVQLTGDYPVNATLDTQSIPLAPLVAAYAPEQAGNVTGQTEIHGTLAGPLKKKDLLEAHITVPTLAVNYKNAVQIAAPQPIRLDYVKGVLDLQRSSLRGTGTDLQFQGRVPVIDKSAPVSLLLLGTVDLRLMQLFDPDVVTSGQLRFDINSYGQRSDPNVQGQIRVVNAAFASGDAPVGLSNGNGVLTLTRDRLNITQFTGRIGGGEVTARGGVLYRPNIQFDMALSGNGIRMMYPDGVRSGLGANLFLTGTTDAALLRGQINLEQLSFSPDFDLTEIMGQFGGTTAPPPSQGFSNNLQLDMAVRSTQGINLVNRQLSMQGSMNLNVRGTAAQPVVLGRINLLGGDFLFNNERFVLQGGTIDFVNPTVTQPVLNVAVNTTVQQYNVSMRFEGPIDRMRTSYTSDPALPPADIIHLIAFGSTSEAAAANPSPPGNLAAEQKIASAVSGQVTSRVAKIAGLSQLSIDPTLGGTGSQSSPGATITVQQRVTSKIFVTFSTDVTSTQNQVIQLEYKHTPRLSFSGTRDQNGGVAFDTRIRKSW